MILNWLLKNWLAVITAIGILYGIGMSTYNFLDNRKTKKRRLKVNISYGWIPMGGDLGDPMVLLEVVNPGDRNVTINTPYIDLPHGKHLITPWPLSHVTFPYELPEGKNCATWSKESQVREALVKSGHKGKVPLRGAVREVTGKKFKSKETIEFDVETPKKSE
jgi:hypothetical protein